MIVASEKKQQGFTLIVVLLLLVVMVVLALSLSSNSSTHTIIANKSVLKAQAFQTAESGSDIVLNYLNEKGDIAFQTLKKKTCNMKFEDQYTANSNNIIKTSSDVTDRKIKSAWYACYPEGQAEVPCDQGFCFAVVIAGVSCPADSNNTITVTDACVISRILQGYHLSHQQL